MSGGVCVCDSSVVRCGVPVHGGGRVMDVWERRHVVIVIVEVLSFLIRIKFCMINLYNILYMTKLSSSANRSKMISNKTSQWILIVELISVTTYSRCQILLLSIRNTTFYFTLNYTLVMTLKVCQQVTNDFQ